MPGTAVRAASADQSIAGNDAFTASTAAFSFASMEMRLQSMVAVNATAKNEVLFMELSFQGLLNCFS